MKCPLLLKTWESKPDTITFQPMNCIKEECAWWDVNSAACAIWAIVSALDALGKLFREIEQKIPPEA